MRATVYLDPSVFVCPTPSDPIDEYVAKLEQYIETLGSLRDRLKSSLFRLLTSRDTAGLLLVANCYPVYPSLRDGLQRAGLGEIYQPGDVVRLVDQLLREANPIEDTVGVNAVIADPLNVTTPMEYVGDGAQRELQDYHYLTLAIGFYLGTLRPDLIWAVGRTKSANGRAAESSTMIKVVGTIRDIELSDEEATVSIPLTIEVFIPCGASCKQLCIGLDLHKLSQDLTESSLVELITVALSQSPNADTSRSKLNWTVGSSFYESVVKLNLQNNPAIFRALLAACTSTICATEMSKTHALRTGPGGNNPQIKKDGACAWRRDIDREFHLHYWSRGESYEFASCVVHNNFSISDPT